MLCNPPQGFRALFELVQNYNQANDPIEAIYYLQAINYLLNKTKLNESLYQWINHEGENSWHHHLKVHGINPYSSFFLTGIQFAQAVENAAKIEADEPEEEVNEYDLMQKRDACFSTMRFSDHWLEYTESNLQLAKLARNYHKTRDTVNRHIEVLALVHDKLEALRTEDDTPNPKYHTQKLSESIGNNINAKLTVEDYPNPLIIRIEDRAELGLEQRLHSCEVSKYFNEDYGVLMTAYTEDGDVVYKPLAISQFANQGNLQDVAKSMRGERIKNIGPQVRHYFVHLADFCTKLMEAGAYHPDIKLSNFLVNNGLVLVSDRKTFVDQEHPYASALRSSPGYAPDEFLRCLTPELDDYNRHANQTRMNMPQFMAFQLGMALKECLILTQVDETPDDLRDQETSAEAWFDAPSNQIINLALLAQELTRPDKDKRLSIAQFRRLINLTVQTPDNFYTALNNELNSQTLGIEEDVSSFESLSGQPLTGERLLYRANQAFAKLSAREDVPDPRLTQLAANLAIRCYRDSARDFIAQSINVPLAEENWRRAPWYRKLAHFLTRGWLAVAQVTHPDEIEPRIDINSQAFQNILPLMEFLPPREMVNSLGMERALRFKNFLDEKLPQEKISEPDISSDEPDYDTHTASSKKSYSSSASISVWDTMVVVARSSSFAHGVMKDSEDEDASVYDTMRIIPDQPAITDSDDDESPAYDTMKIIADPQTTLADNDDDESSVFDTMKIIAEPQTSLAGNDDDESSVFDTMKVIAEPHPKGTIAERQNKSSTLREDTKNSYPTFFVPIHKVRGSIGRVLHRGDAARLSTIFGQVMK